MFICEIMANITISILTMIHLKKINTKCPCNIWYAFKQYLHKCLKYLILYLCVDLVVFCRNQQYFVWIELVPISQFHVRYFLTDIMFITSRSEWKFERRKQEMNFKRHSVSYFLTDGWLFQYSFQLYKAQESSSEQTEMNSMLIASVDTRNIFTLDILIVCAYLKN